MRRAVAIVVVAAIVAAAGWYGLHWIPADFSYVKDDEFESVPHDEHTLAKWVRENHHVWFAGENREWMGDRWRVEISFGMTRNGWGQPPLPDLDVAAGQLGYRVPKRRFRNVRP